MKTRIKVKRANFTVEGDGKTIIAYILAPWKLREQLGLTKTMFVIGRKIN